MYVIITIIVIYKMTQSRQKLSNASHASLFGCVVPGFLQLR